MKFAKDDLPVVRPKPGEDFEHLVRRFLRAFDRSGLAGEAKSRAHYIKPSARQRRERRASIRRARKRAKK